MRKASWKNRGSGESRMNQEAEILKKTYQDSVTVSRKQAGKNQETGETEFKPAIVYEGEPCALCSAGNQAPERDGSHKYTEDEKVLFTCPGIYLQAGDQVTVITAAGQKIKGEAGRTYAYISHGETPVKVESIV